MSQQNELTEDERKELALRLEKKIAMNNRKLSKAIKTILGSPYDYNCSKCEECMFPNTIVQYGCINFVGHPTELDNDEKRGGSICDNEDEEDHCQFGYSPRGAGCSCLYCEACVDANDHESWDINTCKNCYGNSGFEDECDDGFYRCFYEKDLVTSDCIFGFIYIPKEDCHDKKNSDILTNFAALKTYKMTYDPTTKTHSLESFSHEFTALKGYYLEKEANATKNPNKRVKLNRDE